LLKAILGSWGGINTRAVFALRNSGAVFAGDYQEHMLGFVFGRVFLLQLLCAKSVRVEVDQWPAVHNLQALRRQVKEADRGDPYISTWFPHEKHASTKTSPQTSPPRASKGLQNGLLTPARSLKTHMHKWKVTGC